MSPCHRSGPWLPPAPLGRPSQHAGTRAEPPGRPPSTRPELAELSTLLGVVRQLQFDRDRDPATLDAAVKLLDQAADDLPEGPHLPTCLGHLGNALLTRFELDDAQHAFERALAATGPRSPRTAALHSSLGLTLLERYRHAGARCPTHCPPSRPRSGMVPTPAGSTPTCWPLVHRARGRPRAQPHQRRPRRRDRDVPTSLPGGPPQQLEIALTTADRWGAWADHRASWTEAAGAYDLGLDAAERLWPKPAGRIRRSGSAPRRACRTAPATPTPATHSRPWSSWSSAGPELLAEALRDGPDQLEERVPALAVNYHDAAARLRACGGSPAGRHDIPAHLLQLHPLPVGCQSEPPASQP